MLEQSRAWMEAAVKHGFAHEGPLNAALTAPVAAAPVEEAAGAEGLATLLGVDLVPPPLPRINRTRLVPPPYQPDTSRPPPRINRTRLVPPPVSTGHVSSLPQY